MIPGMNPGQMRKMMQRMGIQQQEIDASEVIIKTPDKNIIISNPSVTKVNMMGQETFLVLPHPQVLDYMRAKTANYDRWIGGMQKIFLRQQPR